MTTTIVIVIHQLVEKTKQVNTLWRCKLKVDPCYFDSDITPLASDEVKVYRTEESQPIRSMEFSVLPLESIAKIAYHYQLHPHEGLMLIVFNDKSYQLTKLHHGGHAGPLSRRGIDNVLVSRLDEPFRSARFTCLEELKEFCESGDNNLGNEEEEYLHELIKILPEVIQINE